VPRFLMWRVLATLVLGAALAVLAGAVASGEEPSVAITSPADGSVVEGPDVVVEIAVSGFTMRPPLEPVQEPNTGHVEYLLDVEPAFDQPTPLGEDAIIHSGRLSETFFGVAAGQHTLYLCLAYDDHTCIDPALTDTVRITVGEPLPTEVPTAEPTPEATPEPPPETPSPPPPTPEPTQEAPPETPERTATPEPTAEPPVETPTPTATAAPSPTPWPPRSTLPSAAQTPNPGLAPGTLGDDSDGDNFALLYAGAGAATGIALIAGGLSWRTRRVRSRR
jgi:hypothetical protein